MIAGFDDGQRLCQFAGSAEFRWMEIFDVIY